MDTIVVYTVQQQNTSVEGYTAPIYAFPSQENAQLYAKALPGAVVTAVEVRRFIPATMDPVASMSLGQ